MKKPSFERDQSVTPFADCLNDFCKATGAVCAALVDDEGETVDYAGNAKAFDIRVVAAEWRLVLQHLRASRHLPGVNEFVIRAKKKSFQLTCLPEGYALVIELPRRCTGISDRALSAVLSKIRVEAGFARISNVPGETPAVAKDAIEWTPVSVRRDTSQSLRPTILTMEESDHGVDVIGKLDPRDLGQREHGFRVRLDNGLEGNLVREPLEHWYFALDVWMRS